MSTISDSTVRRLARQNGCFVRKSRSRTWHPDYQGEYMLVDLQYNAAVFGFRYDASLEDLHTFLTTD